MYQGRGNTTIHTLNCRGRILSLERPVVMGILNVTPDSFFDGGKFTQETETAAHVEKMLADGATIIDIGGVSTRPGAESVDTETEWERVGTTLMHLRKTFPQAFFSIDTVSSEVARRSLDEGADIINDISGGDGDPAMFPLIAETKVPYVVTHIQGTPATMQKDPQYHDVLKEVLTGLIRKAKTLRDQGASDIILDPGFGFGKNRDHNYTLLKGLNFFTGSGFPVMVGFSRKSMINQVLGTKPSDALNGTTILNTISLMKGASIIRVHDVKEASEVVKIYLEYSKER